MLPLASKFIAIIFLCFFVSAESFALSKTGHKLVCQLSYDYLPKAKQQQVDKLLNQLTNKQKRNIRKYNYLPTKTPIDFALACTWADAIKKQSKYDSFKSWHYLNIARTFNEVTEDSCKDNCLPRAVLHHQQQLSSEAPAKQRLKALMFLGHWLGDIHQPLHVSYASDLGGNKTPTAHTKCKNLHWYWDDCLIHYKKPSYQELYQELQSLSQLLIPQQWQQEQVWQWANESYQITRSPEMGYCRIQNKKCQPVTEPIELNTRYAEKFNPVLKQQLIKAAHRLSSVLSASL